MTWDLRLIRIAGTAQNGRRPNVSFQCERCGVLVEKYQRPSHKRPRFCSKSCATSASMTAERIRRQSEAIRGDRHYAWQGADTSPSNGRKRARRMYRADACSVCAASPAERHHRDGNTSNNEPENIAIVCRRCHMAADGRLSEARDQMRAIQPLGVAARWRR